MSNVSFLVTQGIKTMFIELKRDFTQRFDQLDNQIHRVDEKFNKKFDQLFPQVRRCIRKKCNINNNRSATSRSSVGISLYTNKQNISRKLFR